MVHGFDGDIFWQAISGYTFDVLHWLSVQVELVPSIQNEEKGEANDMKITKIKKRPSLPPWRMSPLIILEQKTPVPLLSILLIPFAPALLPCVDPPFRVFPGPRGGAKTRAVLERSDPTDQPIQRSPCARSIRTSEVLTISLGTPCGSVPPFAGEEPFFRPENRQRLRQHHVHLLTANQCWQCLWGLWAHQLAKFIPSRGLP